jgi:hypothetical protein
MRDSDRVIERWGATGIVAEALALWHALGWVLLNGWTLENLLCGDRDLTVAVARTGIQCAKEAIRLGAPTPGHLERIQVAALLASGDHEIRSLGMRLNTRSNPPS